MARELKPIYKCKVCGKFTERPVHCGKPAQLLMSSSERLRLSKLMSALLRHIPHEVGLSPDSQGWVSVDELVKAIKERWRNRDLYKWVSRDHVVAVAMLDPKGRFQLSMDGSRIRAAYGHSIRVELGYKPLGFNEAPKTLFHGTISGNLENILKEGLKPMRRLMVHLSASLEDAIETARRHGGDIVVLEIDGLCLLLRGSRLYRASRRVYLSPQVPPDCIKAIRRPEGAHVLS